MVGSTVRQALAQDVGAAAAVYVAALADMQKRLGHFQSFMSYESACVSYQHIFDTGVFQVAEIQGKTVGVCDGIIREGMFFLSGFWVLPEFQGRGIGGQLLAQVWERASGPDILTHSVWSSPDPSACAQYLRLGMLPGFPLFRFSVKLQPYTVPDGYTICDLDEQAAGLIDALVRSTPRIVDHQYFSRQKGVRSCLVKYLEEPAGYCYADDTSIGPVAWLSDVHAETVFKIALSSPEKDAGERQLNVPGCNHNALKYVAARRGKLSSLSNFLSTRPFGKLDQYIPSGPLLF